MASTSYIKVAAVKRSDSSFRIPLLPPDKSGIEEHFVNLINRHIIFIMYSTALTIITFLTLFHPFTLAVPNIEQNYPLSCFSPPGYIKTLNGPGGGFNVCDGVFNLLSQESNPTTPQRLTASTLATNPSNETTVTVGQAGTDAKAVREWKDPVQQCTLSLRAENETVSDSVSVENIVQSMTLIINNCTNYGEGNDRGGYGGKTKVGGKGFWVFLYGYDDSHCS